jgi:hypothetical protein
LAKRVTINNNEINEQIKKKPPYRIFNDTNRDIIFNTIAKPANMFGISSTRHHGAGCGEFF